MMWRQIWTEAPFLFRLLCPSQVKALYLVFVVTYIQSSSITTWWMEKVAEMKFLKVHLELRKRQREGEIQEISLHLNRK